ncbi:MAG: head GIN domain-containing protein [Caldimonas sp.]
MPLPSCRRRAALVLCAALPLACIDSAAAGDLGHPWPTKGSGDVVAEIRSVGAFSSLSVDTGARVVVRQGDTASVVVKAEANVVSLIDVRVDGDRLVVEDASSFSSSTAEVTVTAKRLSGIEARGSVAVSAEGLNVPALSLSLGGSSAMSVKNSAFGKLHVALGGSSTLRLSGTADDLSAALGGSSALRAGELAAGAVSVGAGGSAQAVVWAIGSLQVASAGSSGVAYFGAVHPTLATAGSSTVRNLGTVPTRPQ